MSGSKNDKLTDRAGEQSGMNRESYESAMARLESGLPPAEGAGFLGANLHPEEARVVIIPSTWDVTTSYRPGTAKGPEAIVAASHQLDLDDGSFGKVYRSGIAFLDNPGHLERLNAALRIRAEKVMADLAEGSADPGDIQAVNDGSDALNRFVRKMPKPFWTEEHFQLLSAGIIRPRLGCWRRWLIDIPTDLVFCILMRTTTFVQLTRGSLTHMHRFSTMSWNHSRQSASWSR